MKNQRSVRRRPSLLIAMLLAGSGAVALAGPGIAVIKDTVFERFTKEDLALMKGTVRKALTSGEDGQPLTWTNEKSGSSGSVTPVDRVELKGQPCRRLDIVNEHRGITPAKGIYKFCRTSAQTWKLVGPD